MSDQVEPTDPGLRRRNRVVVILAAVLALVLVAVIVLVAQSRRVTEIAPPPVSTPAGSAAPSASATASASVTAAPSESASGSASPEATSSPTRSAAPTGTAQPTAGGGNQSTKTPVPIEKDSEVKPGLTARVDKLAAVDGKAEGPGEVSGPALRFQVVVDNSTDRRADLSTTVVNLYYGDDKTPGSPIGKPGGSPLPASVAAGAKADGTYLFVVPEDERDTILITVDYSVDTSVVAFSGRGPR